MTHRCENCGAPQPVDPSTAAQLRADTAVAEYRGRWGAVPADTTSALTTLAESRGLSVIDVIEAAAADRLDMIVSMPVVERRHKR